MWSPSHRRAFMFNIRLSEDEYDQFERVAKRLNLSVSAMMRMLVAREEREVRKET